MMIYSLLCEFLSLRTIRGFEFRKKKSRFETYSSNLNESLKIKRHLIVSSPVGPHNGFSRTWQFFLLWEKNFHVDCVQESWKNQSRSANILHLKIFFRNSKNRQVRYTLLGGLIYYQEGWEWNDRVPLDLKWLFEFCKSFPAQKFFSKPKNSESTRKAIGEAPPPKEEVGMGW